MVNEVKSNSETTVSCQHNMQINANKLDTKNTRLINSCGIKCTAPATLNQRDLIHHESEVCQFRKLKCHSCGEMTKTLADMEKRITNVERNMAKMETMVTMETHIKNTQNLMTMATNVANIETRMANMEKNTADMEGKMEAVNNEVRGLKTALIEGFDEMKDVLVKMEDKIEENARKVINTPSGDRENIIVA